MSTTEQQNAIALAAVKVEVSYLKAGMADLRATNAQTNVKLDAVLAQLAEARGGWRTLMLVGGAFATLGSAAGWLISQWRG